MIITCLYIQVAIAMNTAFRHAHLRVSANPARAAPVMFPARSREAGLVLQVFPALGRLRDFDIS